MTQEEISIQKKNPSVAGDFQQDSPVINRQKLRIFAISLAVIGVLGVVAGIASAMILGSPVMLLMALQGLLILIVSAVFLLKIRQPKITPPLETPPSETPPAEIPPSETPPKTIKREFSKKALLAMIHQDFQAGETLTGTFHDFRLGDSVQITFRKGDITIPQVIINETRKGIVFNAANSHINPGQRGVNKALSDAVTSSSWNSSAPAVKPLNPGEVSTGPWISSRAFLDKLTNEGYNCNQTQWSFLGQILGPKASDHQENPASAFPIVKRGYREAMAKALSLGCTGMQFPLLSCGNNAPKSPERFKEWKCMVVLAFLEALKETSSTTSNKLEIILMDCNSDILSDLG